MLPDLLRLLDPDCLGLEKVPLKHNALELSYALVFSNFSYKFKSNASKDPNWLTWRFSTQPSLEAESIHSQPSLD